MPRDLRNRNGDPLLLTVDNEVSALEKLRISVPAVDDALRGTLDEVSVYLVASRERARAFIDFKRINGPAKYAYANAEFAADWYGAGRADGIGLEQPRRPQAQRRTPLAARRSHQASSSAATFGRCSTRPRVDRETSSPPCTGPASPFAFGLRGDVGEGVGGDR